MSLLRSLIGFGDLKLQICRADGAEVTILPKIKTLHRIQWSVMVYLCLAIPVLPAHDGDES
jgi:hypothetical protein